MRKSRIKLLLIIAILVIGTGALAIQTLLKQSVTCANSTNLTSTILRSTLTVRHFGGVWKYELPQDRLPNAIQVAADGSVWFGEQNLPGIGHLYTDGTLVEYKWPFQYTSPTFIWGVAIWKGCAWASDQAGSQLVAVDPSSGSVQTVKLEAGSFPYTLTVGPDDALWFTEVLASTVGRIDPQLRLHEYAMPVAGVPAQIVFANDTLGYYVDTGNVGLVKPGIFSFDPRSFSPVEIGTDTKLLSPTSLTLVRHGFFLALHATSTLAFYNLNSPRWVYFPTSPGGFKDLTLPYFVAANESKVWFNEHYANRMAMLDAAHSLLTEYSLSDRLANKTIGIDNALTFALAKDRVWFTELTANYVGYVNATYKPNFTISPANNPTISLGPGGNISMKFTVSGQSSKPLSIQVADTEGVTGRPQRIIMNSSVPEIQQLNGQETILVNVTADRTLPAGDYTLLVDVTDGLVSQGAYIELEVTTPS